jgi:hypothetical protein
MSLYINGALYASKVLEVDSTPCTNVGIVATETGGNVGFIGSYADGGATVSGAAVSGA